MVPGRPPPVPRLDWLLPRPTISAGWERSTHPPKDVKVGVVNVSVAGCKIELFDKANHEAYAKTAPGWMTGIIKEYGGNPYARLVEMGKVAQKAGVIKGILLHQGESNAGDKEMACEGEGRLRQPDQGT